MNGNRRDAQIRRDLKRRYPPCHWCKHPVVAGQRDDLGRPAHYACQMACWWHKRFHDRAQLNPALPHDDAWLDRPLKAPTRLPRTRKDTKP
jgi:hypothetical protein